ncbi:MAG: hypothetical protein QW117_00470 [Candidatus Pacearchaeota archaeon]
MLSEEEKENIKKEAKNIIDKFSKVLDSVNENIEDFFIEREKDRRKESESENYLDLDFRNTFFENAPNKNNNFLIAEKKKWE